MTSRNNFDPKIDVPVPKAVNVCRFGRGRGGERASERKRGAAAAQILVAIQGVSDLMRILQVLFNWDAGDDIKEAHY